MIPYRGTAPVGIGELAIDDAVHIHAGMQGDFCPVISKRERDGSVDGDVDVSLAELVVAHGSSAGQILLVGQTCTASYAKVLAQPEGGVVKYT